MTYAQIRAMQRGTQFSDMDPRAFALLMAAKTGQPSEYASGVDPSIFSQIDYGINRGIDATGLPDVSAEIFGDLFGETGREIGRNVPRQVLDMVPFLAAEVLSGGAATPLLLARGAQGASAALSGLNAWGATEDPLAAGLAAGIAGFSPQISRAGSQAAMRMFSKPVAGEAGVGLANLSDDAQRTFSSLFQNTPTTLGQAVVSSAGGQAAMFGAGLGSDAVQIGVDPNRDIGELARPEYWAAQAISQTPWLLPDLVRLPGAAGRGREALGGAEQFLRSQRPVAGVSMPEDGVLAPARLANARGMLARQGGFASLFESGDPIAMGSSDPFSESRVFGDSLTVLPTGDPIVATGPRFDRGPAAKAAYVLDDLFGRQERFRQSPRSGELLRNQLFGESGKAPEVVAPDVYGVEPIETEPVTPIGQQPGKVPLQFDELLTVTPLDSTTPKAEVVRQLSHEDPVIRFSAIKFGLSEEEQMQLQRYAEGSLQAGVSPEEALTVAGNLGATWARIKLENNQKGVKDKAYRTLVRNAWLDAQLASSAKKVQAEIAIVKSFLDKHSKTKNPTKTDPWQAYYSWAQGGRQKGEQGLRQKLANTIALANKPEVIKKNAEYLSVYQDANQSKWVDSAEGVDKVMTREEADDVVQKLNMAKNADDDSGAFTYEMVESGEGFKVRRRRYKEQAGGGGIQEEQLSTNVWQDNVNPIETQADLAMNDVQAGELVNAIVAGDDKAVGSIVRKASAESKNRLTQRFDLDWNEDSPLPVDVHNRTADALVEGLQKGLNPTELDKVWRAAAGEWYEGSKEVFTKERIRPLFMALQHERAGIESALTRLKALDGNTDEAMELRHSIDDYFMMKADMSADGKSVEKGLTFLYNMLKATGLSDGEVANRLPALARMWTFVQGFESIDMAQLSNPLGREAAGLFASNEAGQRLVAIAQTKSPELLTWTVAHELVGHGLWDMHDRGLLPTEMSAKLDTFKQSIEGLTPAGRQRLLEVSMEVLPRKIRGNKVIQELLNGDLSDAEVLANVNAIASMSLVSGEKSMWKDFVSYLPKPIADFFEVAARWLRNFVSVFNGGVDDRYRNIFTQHKDHLMTISQANQENQMLAAKFLGLQTLNEPGGIYKAMSTPEAGADWFKNVIDPDTGHAEAFVNYLGGKDFERLFGKGKEKVEKLGGLMAHALAPIRQWMDVDKEYRFFASTAWRRSGELSNFRTEMATMLGGKSTSGIVSFAPDTSMMKVLKDTASEKVFGDLVRLAQKERAVVADLERGGHAEVKRLLDSLPNEQANAVRELVNKTTEINKFGNKRIRDMQYKEAAARIAASALYVSRAESHDLRYEPVHRVLTGFADRLAAGEVFDPAVLTTELQTVLPEPTRLARAVDGFGQMVEKINGLYDYRMSNPWYVSESRFGRHKVSFIIDGEHDYLGADTPAKAQQLADFLAKQEGVTGIEIIQPEEFNRKVGTDSADEYAAITARESENTVQRLVANGWSEEDARGMASMFDPTQAVKDEMAARDFGTIKVRRGFKPGRKFLDPLEQQQKYFDSLMRHHTKQIGEAELSGLKRDSYTRGTPKAQAILENWQNYNDPDSAVTENIGKINYAMYLAGNFANFMQEAGQPMNTFTWKLVDEGAGVVAAHRYVASAYRKMFKAFGLNSLSTVDTAINYSKLSPDERILLQEAEKSGRLTFNTYTDIRNSDMLDAITKSRVNKGMETPTGNRITEGAKDVMATMYKIHNKFTALSSSTALLAAYQHFSKTLPPSQARAKALEVASIGMLTGGRADRPTGAFSTGYAKPLASMALSMQQFALGTITQMAGYYKRAANPKLAPTVRRQALKAALGLTLTQAALAGVLGLPFVGPALRAVQKGTGFDLEEWVLSLNEDAENPDGQSFMKSAFLRGMSNAVGGPDVGSRYSMGGVLGFNEYDVWNPWAIFGAFGSLVGRGASAFVDIGRGDVKKGLAQIAPAALKRSMQLYADDWQFKSANGDILDVNATYGDKLAYALGWNPVRATKLRQLHAVQSRVRERLDEQNGRWYDQLAKDMIEGDIQSVTQEINQRASADATFDPDNARNQIAEHAIRQLFPRDPGAGATQESAAQETRIMSGLGVGANSAELQRAQTKDEFVRALGGRAARPDKFAVAAKVDEIRQRFPMMSIQQARYLAMQPHY